jgi:hypothetical protein
MAQQPSGGKKPMAEKGGCLNLGWGCLPLLAAAALLPPFLLF